MGVLIRPQELKRLDYGFLRPLVAPPPLLDTPVARYELDAVADFAEGFDTTLQILASIRTWISILSKPSPV